MDTALQAHVAFHLTGRRTGAALEPVDQAELRPALLAHYRDLTTLRYDFPLVLADEDEAFVESLSDVCDRVLRTVAQGDDADRVSRHVLRLEQAIRSTVASGTRGSLSALWTVAAADVAAQGDADVSNSLERAEAALHLDGEVVDCDADLPTHLLTHAWRLIQARKARAFQANADALVRRLKDILGADLAYSADGCRPDRLRAAVGGADRDELDFDALSRVLTTAAPVSTLSASRRRRIQHAIQALESQTFIPASSFTFSRPSAALAAYRDRLPAVAAFVSAMAVAELETAQAYREDRHDALFAHASPDQLAPEDLAAFPDYFVSVNSRDLDPVEQSALLEMLAAGLPVKVLLQWDDLFEYSPAGDGHVGLDARSRQIATMAMGAGNAYVAQAPGSFLYQMRRQLVAGMAFQGPALFSVFTGAGLRTGGLPPYLAAAAALESRAFPACVFDPSAGSDWGSRFSLDGNPHVEQDWPAHPLAYEDGRHQRGSTSLAFTLADFMALDSRSARYLARVPAPEQPDAFASVAAAAAAPPAVSAGTVPAIWLIDRNLVVRHALVDERLLREVRRCRDHWRSLQQLAGTRTTVAAPTSAAPAPSPAAPPAPVPDAPAAAAEPPGLPASGDPYIETPRCSTCNECVRINSRMFAYNENGQAYIKDPDAGTFAQLVEAAESCQVAIIHPGTPRNPNEPGLEELVKRAASF
jgi:uncharacterized Fe-S cluster protein YjdI